MNIHEYQSKQVLREYGVKVPNGLPAFTVDAAVDNAEKLGSPVIVVKAQIHAGGRGKAGGVKIARSSTACSSKRAPRSRKSSTFPSSSTASARASS